MITGGHMRKKRLTRKQRIMRKRITIAACIAVVVVVIIVAVVLLLNANRKKSTDTNDNTIVTTSDSSNNTESKAGDSINSVSYTHLYSQTQVIDIYQQHYLLITNRLLCDVNNRTSGWYSHHHNNIHFSL